MFRIVKIERETLSGGREAINFSNRPSAQSETEAFFSVLLGRNGSGKSRLFKDLVNLLNNVNEVKKNNSDPGPTVKKRHKGQLRYVKYQMGQNSFQIFVDRNGEIDCEKNGYFCRPWELDLPKNIIAYTTSIHDKFPLPKRTGSFKVDQSIDGFYQYLGHRERTGRSSGTASIYKVIDRLVSADEFSGRRLAALNRVFRFLNYFPVLHIHYYPRLNLNRIYEEVKNRQTFETSSYQRQTLDHIYRVIEKEEIQTTEVLRIIDNILGTNKRSIQATLDLESGFKSEISYEEISLLVKLRLLNIRSIKCERRDGLTIDLRDSSSGEISLFSSVLGIGSVLENSSLVLLDEPEISLHPEWQKSYLSLLQSCLREFKGHHIVVATHSPLIVSSASRENLEVISLDNDRLAQNESLYPDSSVDYILYDAFDSFNLNNSHFKNILERSLRTISFREFERDDLVPQLAELERALAKIRQYEDRTFSLKAREKERFKGVEKLLQELIKAHKEEISS